MTSSAAAKQPIHPSFISKLDLEYVKFHNEQLANLTPPHTLPWDPSIRNMAAVPGGWTLGNIGSEATFCTHMCVHANCVVISVDYRLAPENLYPTAVEDAIDTLHWIVANAQRDLVTNPNKIAVGGSSSGGNLATVLALKTVEQDLPSVFMFQLLVVPVTDNTASIETSWKGNQLTPWLSPDRMMWFRRNYLPNEADWRKWDASPIFAPDNLVARLPKAWIAVAELDILRDEGIQYGERMRKAGVEVEIEVYKGAPHPIMAMDGEF
ncbi:unnamed protein product [Cyclocybe aegerita]|uniref:Alpha/beta hydrolase fold-3 domain-containing protein n=1 Tax=Cyclocybe aegerita TaxID=1973307 RepID=A0A8S0W5H4_CYCAE|nr:unnamed protein product [Cyclocybe aegerita]